MTVRDGHRAEARIVRMLTFAVLLWVVLQGVSSLLLQVDPTLGPARRIVGIAATAVSVVIFVRLRSGLLRGPLPAHRTAWVLTLVLAGVIAEMCHAWMPMALVVATALLLLPGARGVIAAGTATLLSVVPLVIDGAHLTTVIMMPLIIAILGAVLYVMCRLEVVLGQLTVAQEAVARLQIDQERHRISRELHDILGRTLVAVSLRAQTALRTLERDPAATREHLEEIAHTVTEGQAQLRALVRGGSVVGLADETDAATDLFARLSVTADVDVASIDNPVADQLLARVVRESVTNLLKHSRPRQVRLTARTESSSAVVTVVNDGTPVPATPTSSGTGLTDLAQRIAAVGGSLEAGPIRGDLYRVIARVPLEVTAADAKSADDLVRRIRRHADETEGTEGTHSSDDDARSVRTT